jgi:hypothetical protein
MRRVIFILGFTLLLAVLPAASAAEVTDTTPPDVSCGTADGQWHPTQVSIACTASDGESGLANSADASFSLTTSVAAGTETVDASTDSRNVCDVDGNCTIAGPVSGNKVDLLLPSNPPTVRSTDHKPRKWSRDRRIAMSWTAGADGGSGVDGFSFSINHRSSSLPPATKMNEQGERKATSARLGTGKWWFHLRTRDNVGNWAGAVNRGPYLIDVARPRVRTRSASGKTGHSMTLRYQTGDNTHRTREHITVRRSGSLVKSWSKQMGRALFGRIQTVSFTPHAAGSYSLCVQAWDPARNMRRDCAGVSVKAPPPPPPAQPANCDPNYTGACLDPNASDYDCVGGSGNGPKYTGTVTVVGYDHYGLDSDGDGVGCET